MMNKPFRYKSLFQRHPVPIGVSRSKIASWLASLIFFSFALFSTPAAIAGPGKNADSIQEIRDLNGQYDKSAHRINLSWKLEADAGIETVKVSYSINGKDFQPAGMVWVLEHDNDEYLFRHTMRTRKKMVLIRLTDENGNSKTIEISIR